MIILFVSDTPGTSWKWFELHTSIAESMDSIPGLGSEIPHASWHSPPQNIANNFYIH